MIVFLFFFGNIPFWLLFHLFGYVVVLSISLLAGSLHVLLHGNKIILKINKYPKMVIFGKKNKKQQSANASIHPLRGNNSYCLK